MIVKKGFTLIELLVVISVIGILASIALVSFGPVQKQARDTQRKSDIKQYQNSLEMFASKGNGLYPGENSTVSADSTSGGLCGDLGLTSCSSDPKKSTDATYDYKYQSDGSVSDGTLVATKYVLWAKLENVDKYWVNCSNGKVGTTVGDTISVSGGTCPL